SGRTLDRPGNRPAREMTASVLRTGQDLAYGAACEHLPAAVRRPRLPDVTVFSTGEGYPASLHLAHSAWRPLAGYWSGTTGCPRADATHKTWEAHHSGRSVILQTHLERAELYVEQFADKGLVVTVEPA